ncbi:hypothetical protein GCM10010095_42680 [Streptomyces anthocyanicus]|nr:hypothetical protein GCM10010095_42680 [Streptomyces anthocyanicus]
MIDPSTSDARKAGAGGRRVAHEVCLAGPDSIAPDPEPDSGDGGRIQVVDSLCQAGIPTRNDSAQAWSAA